MAGYLPKLPLGIYFRIIDIKMYINVDTNKGFRPNTRLFVSIDQDKRFRRKARLQLEDRDGWYSWEVDINMFPRKALLIHVKPARRFSWMSEEGEKICILGSELYTGQDPYFDREFSYKRKMPEFDLYVDFEVQDFPGSESGLSKGQLYEKLSSGMNQYSSMNIYRNVQNLRPLLDRLGTAGTVMGAVVQVADSLSDLHPIASVVVKAVSMFYTALENEKEFQTDIQTLGDSMTRLLVCLKDLGDSRALETSKALSDTAIDILEAALEAARFVEDYLKHDGIRKLADAQFNDDLGRIKENFELLENRFRDALVTSSHAYQVRITEQQTLRQYLKPVDDRHIGTGCDAGTREDIIVEIEEWLQARTGPNVLWLTGAAGAGKTAITYTLASKYKDRCAHFFVLRGDYLRSDFCKIWPTIAWDLATLYPSVQPSMLQMIQGTAIPSSSRFQYETFIKRTLKLNDSELSTKPPVFIVDGVDELINESHFGESLSDFVDTLRSWSELPSQYRLILSSQIRPFIEDKLDGCCKVVHLQTGEAALDHVPTQRDLRLYFEHRLKAIAKAQKLPEGWPEDSDIDRLVLKAEGTFQWGKQAMDHVGNGDSKKALADLLEDSGSHGIDLDRLYTKFLNDCFQGLGHDQREDLLQVLAMIVLAKSPLSSDDLKELRSGEDVIQRFRSYIGKLGGIIHLEHDGRYRVQHSTFYDYILGTKRSFSYTIDIPLQSYRLTKACLKQVSDACRGSNGMYNVLPNSNSHLLNSEIPGLSENIRTVISSSLAYSLRFWVSHLLDIGHKASHHLTKHVRSFMERHFLSWLEAMSYLESVHAVPSMLLSLAKWAEDVDMELVALLIDGARFTVTFMEPISLSAPHVYVSALPFAPNHSLIASKYREDFFWTLRVVEGQLLDWPRLNLKLTGHQSGVRCAAFSSDGTRIASCSADGSVRIWDGISGRQIWSLPILSKTKPRVPKDILSIALHPEINSSSIAWVLSDGTCHLLSKWTKSSLPRSPSILLNIPDELPRPPFNRDGIWFEPDFLYEGETHLTFSQTGSYLAYNFRGELHIYDAESQKLLAPSAERYDRAVLCFAFSPVSDDLVASSYPDCTIRFWDLKLGRQKKLVYSRYDKVRHISFLPDGERIAVAEDDQRIHILSFVTGSCLMTMNEAQEHSGPIRSVSVSRDGRYVVSGSEDATVRVWAIDSGRLVVTPLIGHEKSVRSVAFSPDDRVVVSASDDGTVRLWDVVPHSRRSRRNRGCNAKFTTVAYSSDGEKFIAGSEDGMLWIFEADTFQPTSGPIDHGGHVTSVVFSPSNQRFASAGHGDEVRVWLAIDPRHEYAATLRHHTRSISREFDETGHDRVECIQCVAFFPNNDLKLASGDDMGQINVWDLSVSPIHCNTFTLHPRGQPINRTIQSLAITANGGRIIAAAGDRIYIWGTDTGDRLRSPIHHFPANSNFDLGDPQNCIGENSGNDDSYSNWSLDSSLGSGRTTPLEDFDYDSDYSEDSDYHPNALDFIYAIAISPDGSRVISGGRHTIRVWDAWTGERAGDFHPIRVHERRVNCLQISPLHPDRVISGSSDGTLRMWSLSTGQSLAQPWQSGARVIAIACSPKVDRFLAVTDDGTLRLWCADIPAADVPNDVVRVEYIPESDCEPQLGENQRDSWRPGTGALRYAYFDAEGEPVVDDQSKMEDGWVYKSNGTRLFWVPPQSRAGFCWPRNRRVEAPAVVSSVKIDLSHLYHGADWSKCRRPVPRDDTKSFVLEENAGKPGVQMRSGVEGSEFVQSNLSEARLIRETELDEKRLKLF